MSAFVTELVPIDRIRIANPRSRNQHVFREIIESIRKVGLKRPVIVSRRAKGQLFDLVCGQGRVEAFRALGETTIPAIVLEAPVGTCMVMSLVENVARRRHTHAELLGDIGRLRLQGYGTSEIATKTGLSDEYITGIANLIDKGEQRLINGVEQGLIPLSVAVEIAEIDHPEVQEVLQRAYEAGSLKGHKFIAAKRLLERRLRKGKKSILPVKSGKKLTVSNLIKIYEEDADKKRRLIREARAADDQLTVLAHLIGSLMQDAAFRALLERQQLASLPIALTHRIGKGELGAFDAAAK